MSLKPFCFEPTVEDIDNRIYEALRVNPIQTINYVGRTAIHPSNWCLCKKCPILQTDKECICCFEFENISKLHSNIKCVIELSSFKKIIMDEEVLNITRQQMILKTNDVKRKKMLSTLNPENKTWRFICYKQFTHWINSWTAIGKGNRVCIPACVVQAIRNKYPENNGIYVGFKENYSK
ncbi:uncharacterized protein LOC111034857 [Myzus persicae]|uniref:uncharacterized protein LOC111034857 n=1 Tax=Myzus persicae TaxID=13164 RepID=UPI000B939F15|nr:uncharacterized protein LOC111034857 [Myzus persicae]